MQKKRSLNDMRLNIVGTGSSGNCYLLESGKRYLALDAGISWKGVLKACEYKPSAIDALLVTHEHSDHSAYIKDFDRACIPVFGNAAVKEKYPCVRTVPTGRTIEVGGGWKVIAFDVPHTHNDGTECPNNAYIIEYRGERLLYMTDWMYCKYNLSKLKINHFLIAVNYTDLEEDESGKIDHVVKGHSSLETAKEFLESSMTDSCRNIICCHLSSRNADDIRILEEIQELVDPTINVIIAKKGITYIL